MYFQCTSKARSFQSSSIVKRSLETNPATLPFPAFDCIPVYPVIKSLHIREGPQAAAATEASTARSLAAFLRCLGQGASAGHVLHHWGLAIVPPPFSSHRKYAAMINQVTPYNYLVPVLDDGNMPDVPSHPQDPHSPSLEWLRKLNTSIDWEKVPFPVSPIKM